MKFILISNDNVFIYLSKLTVRKNNKIQLLEYFTDTQKTMEYLTQNASNSELMPDLIILDIDMAFEDVLSFINDFDSIRLPIKQKIKLYACSALAKSEEIIIAKNHHIVSGHILKPITEEKLQKMGIPNLESKSGCVI